MAFSNVPGVHAGLTVGADVVVVGAGMERLVVDEGKKRKSVGR